MRKPSENFRRIPESPAWLKTLVGAAVAIMVSIALFGIPANNDLYHKIPFHYNKLRNKDPTMIDGIIVS